MFCNRIDGYRNSKRMAINGMVKWLCKEEDVVSTVGDVPYTDAESVL